jgi:hypothetical protein
MERDVLIESGYRCAIPRCGATQIQIHHIVPWADVQEHTFDNLIVLCANCHQRVTNGEIDRKAVRQIKANLSVVFIRYGELERRYLEFAAEKKMPPGGGIALPGGFELLMGNLVRDGLVAAMPGGATIGTAGAKFAIAVNYRLTPKGAEFIEHWLTAAPLD